MGKLRKKWIKMGQKAKLTSKKGAKARKKISKQKDWAEWRTKKANKLGRRASQRETRMRRADKNMAKLQDRSIVKKYNVRLDDFNPNTTDIAFATEKELNKVNKLANRYDTKSRRKRWRQRRSVTGYKRAGRMGKRADASALRYQYATGDRLILDKTW